MMSYTRTNGTVVVGAALVLTLIASPFVTAADQPLAGGDPGRGFLIPAQMEGMGMMKGMEGCGKNMGAMMDTDKDGKVSKDEFTKHHDDTFAQMDTNKDGTLDQSEMGHMGKMMESHCAGMPMKGGMGEGM
jgi:EF hand